MTNIDKNRRPLASRQLSIFQRSAQLLNHWGLSPNAISSIGLLFGIGSGLALAMTHGQEVLPARWAWLLAAILIQLRLLCNLLDGMVAIEGNQRSPVGELFNEVPDRLADVATLIGAGFAVGGTPLLGFSTAIFAVFIAYLRALGAAATGHQAFHGPMAKPQRMFTMTILCLFYGVTPSSWQNPIFGNQYSIINLALIAILAGGIITIFRRLRAISGWLKQQAGQPRQGE